LREPGTKIIIRLSGGLGNQLFQYATGRYIATKNNAELMVDDTMLNVHRYGVTKRAYELDFYHIRARKLSTEEKIILQLRVRRPFRYLYDVRIIKSSFIYYRESHFEFDPKLHQLTGNLIIEGYWQSERYFNKIAEDIRRDLQPVTPPQVTIQGLLDQVMGTNSVSIHVRRGDFIHNPRAASSHVVCDLLYYQRAVAFIAERVTNPVFFVFTDDPDWVSKYFDINFPMVLVSRPRSIPAYEDLRLMSHCANNIMANSSFSWWGSWLNPNPEKIVVAPVRWFQEEKNMQDLIPHTWNVL